LRSGTSIAVTIAPQFDSLTIIPALFFNVNCRIEIGHDDPGRRTATEKTQQKRYLRQFGNPCYFLENSSLFMRSDLTNGLIVNTIKIIFTSVRNW
jgi:hypothetical protein